MYFDREKKCKWNAVLKCVVSIILLCLFVVASYTCFGCKGETFIIPSHTLFPLLVLCSLCSHFPSFVWERKRERDFLISLQKQPKMEKALTKVTSLKIGLGDSWFTKKAKEEFSNISQDINVSNFICFLSLSLSLSSILFYFPLMWFIWVLTLTL